jgi:hypothetical protein
VGTGPSCRLARCDGYSLLAAALNMSSIALKRWERHWSPPTAVATRSRQQPVSPLAPDEAVGIATMARDRLIIDPLPGPAAQPTSAHWKTVEAGGR